jgi:hypothetical protein
MESINIDDYTFRMAAFRIKKGDIYRIVSSCVIGKCKLGGYLYANEELFSFSTSGKNKIARINKIPSLMDRIKEQWNQKEYILYLFGAERLEKLNKYERRKSIDYTMQDYAKTIVKIIKIIFVKYYIIEAV